jgi:hypothetical protein
MSSVVSGVGNAIGGVLKGVGSVVTSITKGLGNVVKSIGSSGLGKAILIAGAVYFGGAALAGGFGSSAAGGSFFSGMGAGVSSAASSLSTAWGSVLQGNFAEAGSTIGNSWGAAGQAGGMTTEAGRAALANPVSLSEAPAASTGSAPLTHQQQLDYLDSIKAEPGEVSAKMGTNQVWNGQPGTQLNYDMTGSTGSTGIKLGSSAADNLYSGAKTSMFDKVISSPYTAPALISGGMQVAGGYMQGKAQEQQLADQREYEARMAKEQRDRYNANVGAPLWQSQQAPIYQSGTAAWDPYAEARARTAQLAAASAQPQGVAARYMNPV